MSINNPDSRVIIDNTLVEKIFENHSENDNNIPKSDEIKEIDLYNEEDYFFKKPRMRRYIEDYDLTITPPPQKQDKEEMPLLLVIGPMITMAITSLVMLTNTLVKVLSGKQNFYNHYLN